jgi:DNA-binding NtrC family response regulator
MNRFLLIDDHRETIEQLGLSCLGRGVGVVLADNLCEGVRALLSTDVSLIVVGVSALHFSPRELATLFERVAPGVPVVVTVGLHTSLDARVNLELAGFRVVSQPVTAADLIAKEASGC